METQDNDTGAQFVATICDSEVLLTQGQITEMLNIIRDARILVTTHVGKGKGNTGYGDSYIHEVVRKLPTDWLKVAPIAADYIAAIVLAKQLRDGEEKV
jgi:hypothetical protein